MANKIIQNLFTVTKFFTFSSFLILGSDLLSLIKNQPVFMNFCILEYLLEDFHIMFAATFCFFIHRKISILFTSILTLSMLFFFRKTLIFSSFFNNILLTFLYWGKHYKNIFYRFFICFEKLILPVLCKLYKLHI